MRRGLVALLIVALCPSARGDDVVLRSGRTLSGTIVKEDDKRVTLQIRGGEMSIARSDIEEIRRGPAPAGTAAAPPEKKPEASTPADPSSDAKAGARGLLDKLNAIVLTPWEHEAPSVVTEHTIAGYKVVGTDGSSKVTFTGPKSADGVAALYMLSRTLDGRTKTTVDGVEQWYWNRMYWNDDARMWSLLHQGETRFKRDAELAGQVTDACCRDEKTRGAAYADARTITRMLQSDRAASTVKERAKLREDCSLATGSKDAGELLAQVLELHVEIMIAKSPAEKVAVAMKRREALRRLVDAVGG